MPQSRSVMRTPSMMKYASAGGCELAQAILLVAGALTMRPVKRRRHDMRVEWLRALWLTIVISWLRRYKTNGEPHGWRTSVSMSPYFVVKPSIRVASVRGRPAHKRTQLNFVSFIRTSIARHTAVERVGLWYTLNRCRGLFQQADARLGPASNWTSNRSNRSCAP